jgi:osmotically-inducible protein OsmY
VPNGDGPTALVVLAIAVARCWKSTALSKGTLVTISTLSNLDLLRHVEDELRWDPAVSVGTIHAAVDDGAVTLTGTAPTLPSRVAAVKAVKRVKGVRVVADELTVTPVAGAGQSDHEIAHVVEQLLRWNSQVPETVRATVRDGIVTLDGIAEWEFQRQAAEHTVHHLDGVRRVDNNIVISKPASTHDVQHRITAALHRCADVDAHAIEVETRDGTVWLRGRVSSWAERERAEAAAWSAPGISTVHNNICLI